MLVLKLINLFLLVIFFNFIYKIFIKIKYSSKNNFAKSNQSRIKIKDIKDAEYEEIKKTNGIN